jgi:hypothetical protein
VRSTQRVPLVQLDRFFSESWESDGRVLVMPCGCAPNCFKATRLCLGQRMKSTKVITHLRFNSSTCSPSRPSKSSNNASGSSRNSMCLSASSTKSLISPQMKTTFRIPRPSWLMEGVLLQTRVCKKQEKKILNCTHSPFRLDAFFNVLVSWWSAWYIRFQYATSIGPGVSLGGSPSM